MELERWIILGKSLVMGDFNTVCLPDDHLSGWIDQTTGLFNDMLTRTELTECKHQKQFTFQGNDPLQQSRIDLIPLKGTPIKGKGTRSMEISR